jgi:hypothetical protein
VDQVGRAGVGELAPQTADAARQIVGVRPAVVRLEIVG